MKLKIDMEWHQYTLLPWTKVTLTDGTVHRGGSFMRRRAPDGAWQYREMNDEEYREYQATKAW